MLSNSEEDKLLASPAPSNGSSQDDLVSSCHNFHYLNISVIKTFILRSQYVHEHCLVAQKINRT